MPRTVDTLRIENQRLRRKIARLDRARRKENRSGAAISPFAPARFPDLPSIDGVRFAAAEAGVRYRGRLDVMLAEIEAGASIAGAFTRSSTRSAPVLACERHLAAMEGKAATGAVALLVNAGNANAFTGKNGFDATERLIAAVAGSVGTSAGLVFPASTGVIGEALPDHRIVECLDVLVDALDEDAIEQAARAIMTTDTFPKGAERSVMVGKSPVKIAGIAKGSGMIAPDMATMLVYIFTDARIAPQALQDIVTVACNRTFNAITVDSDTSTSDTLIVAATGKAGNTILKKVDQPAAIAFAEALEDVMRDLAHQVVKDGEGASKFIEIAISGARDDADAGKVARAIADSPLVKTAVAGEDPNWGRIVMAVGKSGAEADRDLLSIRFGDVLVAENGWVAASYREVDGARYMKGSEIRISVDLGLGEGTATVWTCDFTHKYISINADYRS